MASDESRLHAQLGWMQAVSRLSSRLSFAVAKTLFSIALHCENAEVADAVAPLVRRLHVLGAAPSATQYNDYALLGAFLFQTRKDTAKWAAQVEQCNRAATQRLINTLFNGNLFTFNENCLVGKAACADFFPVLMDSSEAPAPLLEIPVSSIVDALANECPAFVVQDVINYHIQLALGRVSIISSATAGAAEKAGGLDGILTEELLRRANRVKVFPRTPRASLRTVVCVDFDGVRTELLHRNGAGSTALHTIAACLHPFCRARLVDLVLLTGVPEAAAGFAKGVFAWRLLNLAVDVPPPSFGPCPHNRDAEIFPARIVTVPADVFESGLRRAHLHASPPETLTQLLKAPSPLFSDSHLLRQLLLTETPPPVPAVAEASEGRDLEEAVKETLAKIDERLRPSLEINSSRELVDLDEYIRAAARGRPIAAIEAAASRARARAPVVRLTPFLKIACSKMQC